MRYFPIGTGGGGGGGDGGAREREREWLEKLDVVKIECMLAINLPQLLWKEQEFLTSPSDWVLMPGPGGQGVGGKCGSYKLDKVERKREILCAHIQGILPPLFGFNI